jgi:hypothetical protein
MAITPFEVTATQHLLFEPVLIPLVHPLGVRIGADHFEIQKGMSVTHALLHVLLDSAGIGLWVLQRLHVGSLPSLGALHYVELHGLTFLQALETTRVDCRVVHEDIFAVLTRDEAEALGVIEPLHSTLFHFDRVSWIELRWRIGATTGRILLGWASTAHARFD